MHEQKRNVFQHIENEANKLISRAGEGAITELDLSLLKSWIEKISDSKAKLRYETIVKKIQPLGRDHQIKQITMLMMAILNDAGLKMDSEMKTLGDNMQNIDGELLMRSFCEFLMHSSSIIDRPKLSNAEIAELKKQLKGFGDASGDALDAKFYIFLDLYNSIVNP